jgi:hypothetical protein
MAFDREPMYLLSTAGVLLTHAEGFARDADGTLCRKAYRKKNPRADLAIRWQAQCMRRSSFCT